MKIIKITESNYNHAFQGVNYVQFHGLILTPPLDNEENTCEFLAVTTPPDRKIEFIGDSIMAGYMNLCRENNANELSQYGDYALESFAAAWPALVARDLGAQHHTIGEGDVSRVFVLFYLFCVVSLG